MNEKLKEAIRFGKTEEISRILAEGEVDVNAQDVFGNTLLMEAVNSGKVESVELLVEAGADVNGNDSFGRAPLVSAVEYGKTQILERLLAAGADVTEKAFGQAVSFGRVEMVDRLIKAGVDVKSKGGVGGKALTQAADRGQVKIVERLIEAGVDLNARDSFGRTPVISAVRSGRTQVLESLLAAGADVNTKDPFGKTALIQAASQADYDSLAKPLLCYGAEVTTDGMAYQTLNAGGKERMSQSKAAQEVIANSVDASSMGEDRDSVYAIATSRVFASDKAIAELAAPEAKEFIDGVVGEAKGLYTKLKDCDKGTRDFVIKNSSLIDDSLADSSPKTWDVDEVGARKALVNLAARHGDKIIGIEELQGAGVKVVKDFIDHIPEKNGKICEYSVGEYEARVLAKDPSVGEDRRLDEAIMKEVLKYLKPGDISLAETKAHHVPAPRSPQHAGKKVDDKKEQGPRGGKGGGMGGR